VPEAIRYVAHLLPTILKLPRLVRGASPPLACGVM